MESVNDILDDISSYTNMDTAIVAGLIAGGVTFLSVPILLFILGRVIVFTKNSGRNKPIFPPRLYMLRYPGCELRRLLAILNWRRPSRMGEHSAEYIARKRVALNRE